MRLKLASVLLVVLMAIVAGCGGSEESASTTPTATTTETTTTETTTSEDTATTAETDSSGSGGSSSFASSKNCLELLGLSAKFAEAFAATGGGNDLDTTSKFFQDVADNAPEEIRDDFEVIAEAFTAYVKALGDADLKPGTQPTPEQIQALTKAGESFSDSEVTKAGDNIEAWAEKNCPS